MLTLDAPVLDRPARRRAAPAARPAALGRQGRSDRALRRAPGHRFVGPFFATYGADGAGRLPVHAAGRRVPVRHRRARPRHLHPGALRRPSELARRDRRDALGRLDRDDRRDDRGRHPRLGRHRPHAHHRRLPRASRPGARARDRRRPGPLVHQHPDRGGDRLVAALRAPRPDGGEGLRRPAVHRGGGALRRARARALAKAPPAGRGARRSSSRRASTSAASSSSSRGSRSSASARRSRRPSSARWSPRACRTSSRRTGSRSSPRSAIFIIALVANLAGDAIRDLLEE